MRYDYALESLESFATNFTGRRQTGKNEYAEYVKFVPGDQDFLQRSNTEIIRGILSAFDEADATEEYRCVWKIRIRNAAGEITNACRAVYDIEKRLATYPVLDEEHFAQLAFDEFQESWRGWIFKDILSEISHAPIWNDGGKIYDLDFDFLDNAARDALESLLFSRHTPHDGHYWNDHNGDFATLRYCADMPEKITLDDIVNACFADLENYYDRKSGVLFAFA